MRSVNLEKQKQPPEVSYKEGVLKNFEKFTGKYLCQSLFFNKVPGRGLQLCWKKILAQLIFYEFLEIFKTIFYRIPLSNCFWKKHSNILRSKKAYFQETSKKEYYLCKEIFLWVFLYPEMIYYKHKVK